MQNLEINLYNMYIMSLVFCSGLTFLNEEFFVILIQLIWC